MPSGKHKSQNKFQTDDRSLNELKAEKKLSCESYLS